MPATANRLACVPGSRHCAAAAAPAVGPPAAAAVLAAGHQGAAAGSAGGHPVSSAAPPTACPSARAVGPTAERLSVPAVGCWPTARSPSSPAQMHLNKQQQLRHQQQHFTKINSLTQRYSYLHKLISNRKHFNAEVTVSVFFFRGEATSPGYNVSLSVLFIQNHCQGRIQG